MGLTVYTPPERRRDRRRERVRYALYMVAGIIILTAMFAAMGSPWWFLAFAVEAWWLWAVWSDGPR